MTKNSQKWRKMAKNHKNLKNHDFGHFFSGASRDPPGAKKKASLSNRRIGTRNTDSHMVSIQKCQKSTLRFRGCARPFLEGGIRAKLKFFFELFQKWAKNRYFWPKFDIFRLFCHFSPKSPKIALFSPFFATPSYLPYMIKNTPFMLTFIVY